MDTSEEILIKWFPPSWVQIKFDNIVEAYNLPKFQGHKIKHKKGNGFGYIITINKKSIYHTGDSDLIPEMEKIKDIELAFLPVGNRDFTMDTKEALIASQIIKPRFVVPIHRYNANLAGFKEKVEQNNNSKVLVVEIGEIIKI